MSNIYPKLCLNIIKYCMVQQGGCLPEVLRIKPDFFTSLEVSTVKWYSYLLHPCWKSKFSFIFTIGQFFSCIWQAAYPTSWTWPLNCVCRLIGVFNVCLMADWCCALRVTGVFVCKGARAYAHTLLSLTHWWIWGWHQVGRGIVLVCPACFLFHVAELAILQPVVCVCVMK